MQKAAFFNLEKAKEEEGKFALQIDLDKGSKSPEASSAREPKAKQAQGQRVRDAEGGKRR